MLLEILFLVSYAVDLQEITLDSITMATKPQTYHKPIQWILRSLLDTFDDSQETPY